MCEERHWRIRILSHVVIISCFLSYGVLLKAPSSFKCCLFTYRYIICFLFEQWCLCVCVCLHMLGIENMSTFIVINFSMLVFFYTFLRHNHKRISCHCIKNRQICSAYNPFPICWVAYLILDKNVWLNIFIHTFQFIFSYISFVRHCKFFGGNILNIILFWFWLIMSFLFLNYILFFVFCKKHFQSIF